MTTFLLTNDDGMDAPGLAALETALRSLARVVVLAPDSPQSGISHKVSLWEPVEVLAEGRDRFRVFGTPADCVRIGLNQIAPEADFVFSGINLGANLGYDIYLSGTVAAAREAAFQGKPAMALSQYIRPETPTDWEAASRLLMRLLPELMALPLDGGEFFNLNLPSSATLQTKIPEWRFCHPEKTPYDTCIRLNARQYAYTADIHARPRPPGSDVDICFGGGIALSRLSI